MGRKKKGRAAKKTKASLVWKNEPEELVRAPHSFVIYRGRIGKNANELMQDFRRILEPFTASHLKVRKSNVIKDYVATAGLLNVTHLVVFTKTIHGSYVRFVCLPRGPTLTFRIQDYSLARDVLASLKRPVTYASQFSHHPLLVLNNFTGEGMHLKLMASLFQNMFPSINVNKVKLNTIRRCLLLNYNKEDQQIELRHYTIKVMPTGMSRAVKKLIQSKVPNLGSYGHISEFILKSGNLSESEVELDEPNSQVILPQDIASRGNLATQKSSVRLVELGPRMTLKLLKIQEGILDGEVLYHDHVRKTEKEIEALKNSRAKKMKLKHMRRRQQKENIRQKENEKQKNKVRSLKEMKHTLVQGTTSENAKEDGMAVMDDAGDDAEWYRKEVGKEPDRDLFPRKRKTTEARGSAAKRAKTEADTGKNPTMSVQQLLHRRKKRKEQQKFKRQKKLLSRTVKSTKSKLKPRRLAKQKG